MSTPMLRANEQPNGRFDAGERGRVAPALALALAQQFELLGTAQRGMKRLRALVLRLAVQGKLVPQRVDEEPAHLLLQRSRAAAAERMKAGHAKREAPADPVKANEQPFALPNGWTWARVVDTGEYINGMAFKPTDWSEVGRPIIRIQNLSGRSSAFNRTRMDVDASVVVSAGDVLVSWSATLDAFIWEGEEGVLNQHIFRVVPSAAMAKAYLFLLLKHVISELANSRHAHGLVMTHINRGPFLDYPVAMPPLAEQHRIVERVEELMKLCDALEAKQRLADEQHARLTSTLFEALAASESPDARLGNWQRLAEHFDLLLDRDEAVDMLEKMIVSQAVRGLLEAGTDEHSQDAPARQLPLIQSFPHEVPGTWKWTRLEAVLVAGPTNGFSPKPSMEPTKNRSLTLSATTKGYFKSEFFKYVDIAPEVARKYYLKRGDLLVQRANSLQYVGVAAVYDGDDDLFIYPDLMMRLQVDSSVASPHFVRLWLNSDHGRTYFRSRATGTQGNMPKINQGVVREAPLPVPPLAEQHRIVARVEELRGLCAQLRERLSAAREVQSRLADALVAGVA